jgi:CHASE2 domain-containing sensor protein
MSNSKQEEIISALWVIAALLAFGNGFFVWGWVFAIKAALDTACAILYGISEVIAEKRTATPNVEFSGTPAALSPEAPLERRVGREEN